MRGGVGPAARWSRAFHGRGLQLNYVPPHAPVRRLDRPRAGNRARCAAPGARDFSVPGLRLPGYAPATDGAVLLLAPGPVSPPGRTSATSGDSRVGIFFGKAASLTNGCDDTAGIRCGNPGDRARAPGPGPAPPRGVESRAMEPGSRSPLRRSASSSSGTAERQPDPGLGSGPRRDRGPHCRRHPARAYLWCAKTVRRWTGAALSCVWLQSWPARPTLQSFRPAMVGCASGWPAIGAMPSRPLSWLTIAGALVGVRLLGTLGRTGHKRHR